MHEDTTRWIIPTDPEWPAQLHVLGDDMPESLWVRGTSELNVVTEKSVGITGSRAATMYGEQVTLDMAQSLSHVGWTVVTGGAFGIDVAAIRGTSGTPTVVVLACGVDRVYPSAHESVFQNVLADGGLIVSEYDLGATPTRTQFLRRNRVIAALTRATVVVEAGLRSGSISTAHHAKRLGRPVMAVPGPVTSITSSGTHHLIRHEGALLVQNYADVIAPLT